MPKRTRLLVILLGLSLLLYLSLNVDWSAPGRYYRDYQQLNTLASRKDQIDLAVSRLQERYGKNAGMTYSVSSNFNGSFSQTLQVTRNCGPLDSGKLLDDAKQFFREVGLGKVDRIEYLYGCDAPLPFGMVVDAFNQTFNAALQEHPWCRKVATTSSIDIPGSVTQIWTDRAAGASARLSLDEEGVITRGSWLDASLASVEKKYQYQIMVCMTRSAIRVLEPSISSDEMKSLMRKIWFSPTKSATTDVGRYTFNSQINPLGLTVTRVRKD